MDSTWCQLVGAGIGAGWILGRWRQVLVLGRMGQVGQVQQVQQAGQAQRVDLDSIAYLWLMETDMALGPEVEPLEQF